MLLEAEIRWPVDLSSLRIYSEKRMCDIPAEISHSLDIQLKIFSIPPPTFHVLRQVQDFKKVLKIAVDF